MVFGVFLIHGSHMAPILHTAAFNLCLELEGQHGITSTKVEPADSRNIHACNTVLPQL
jgi:hypothetical protein